MHLEVLMRGRNWLTAGVQWGLPFVVGVAVMAAVITSRPLATEPGSHVSETPAESVIEDVAPPQLGAEQLARAFRLAARDVLPAVVQIGGRIRTSSPHHSMGWGDSFLVENPENEWFAGTLPGMGRRSVGNSRQPALGSGVIVDPSGIVLTNNHLVQDVDELFVQMADDQRFPVVDVRTDAASDLAVLRIKTPVSLPAARLGDSDRLEIGDWVLTIGSPLDLRQTVSAGIISATGRRVEGAGNVGLLQTDAAINPGSSGGALVNLRGDVVGITTGIATEDGGYQGIGFAIPVNLALPVVAQVGEKGRQR